MATFQFYENAFEVKYLKHIGATKTPYYQRRVPAQLVARFNTKMLKIRINLAKGSVITQVNDLAKWHDSLFKGMMDNPNVRLPSDKEAAISLLYEYGLREGQGFTPIVPSKNAAPEYGDTPHLDDFFHYYNERKVEGRLTDIDDLALQALKSPLPKMLSELFDVYISVKPRPDWWIIKKRRVWARFLSVVGNMPAVLVDRDAARKYRDARELATVKRRNEAGELVDRAIKSGTMESEINLLRAVFSESLPELKLNIPNPFTRMRSTKQGKDAYKRETLDRGEMEHLIKYCREQNDDLATVLLMEAFSGARLGELVGLRKSDVRLDDPIPSFTIAEYGEKTVKTEQSLRTVPIHPVVLPLLRTQHKRTAKSDALFGQYNNLKDRPKSDAASGALNKRLKGIFKDKHITNHCFRHSLIDAFDNANISEDRRKQFMGHSRQGVAANYGKGRSLEVKYEDLLLAMDYK